MRFAAICLGSLSLSTALVIPREPGGSKKGQDFKVHEDANARIMGQYKHEKPAHDPYTLSKIKSNSNMMNLVNSGQGNHGAHQGGRENRPPAGGRKRSEELIIPREPAPGGSKKGQDFKVHEDANARIMGQYKHEKPAHDPYTLSKIKSNSNMMNLVNSGQGNHGAHQGGRENRPPAGGRKRSVEDEELSE
jgi:hypothetical protein